MQMYVRCSSKAPYDKTMPFRPILIINGNIHTMLFNLATVHNGDEVIMATRLSFGESYILCLMSRLVKSLYSWSY